MYHSNTLNNRNKMKKTDFITALEIISENHSNEVIINKVREDLSCPDASKPTLHIKNCVPAVINKLIKASYMLSMQDGLLSVDKL